MTKDRTDYNKANAWIILAFIALALVLGLAIAAEAQGGGVSNPEANPAVTNTPVPAIQPLTREEEEEVRVAQIEARDAQAAYSALVEDANKRLLQSPEFRAQQARMQQLQQVINKLFTARKLKQDEDATLCDGPDQRPACAGMGKRRLELRPAPKKPGAEEK